VGVQKLLQFAEITVNGIRGVRDMQCWIFLIGEQIWRIGVQAPIGRPDSAMRVLPSLPVLRVCPLF